MYVFELNCTASFSKMGPAGSLGYGRNSYDFQEGTVICSAPGQVMSNNARICI